MSHIEENDDPFATIMGEGNSSEGASSKSIRRINHVGNSGRYMVPFKELSKAEREKLKPDQLEAYEKRKELEEAIADRAKFKAVVLYVTEDIGRALWPDGRVFTGTSPLCQSERIQAPFDNAFVNSKMDPLHKSALKSAGHTGKCSTCQIGTDLCKPRLIAYIVDLDHIRAVDAYNAAHPETFVEYQLTKLDAKGPQSTWNFRSLYEKLRKKAKSEGLAIGDYIVEFKSEPGSQGSKKVTFEVVDEIAKDNPLYSFVRMLAREALDASKYVRKNFSALPLNKTTTHSALPAGKEEVDGYIVPEEIPF